MCQAYEGEAAAIRSSEDSATRRGFFDALAGKNESKNPYKGPWDSYERKAWEHGRHCAVERFLPWTIESRVRKMKNDEYGDGVEFARQVKAFLKKNGRLPVVVERRVR